MLAEPVDPPDLPLLRVPTSPSLMVQQAVDAIQAAYKDGITRQWVRLRLDMVSLPERVSKQQWQWDADNGWRRMPLPPAGPPTLHWATLPLAKQLVNTIEVGAAEKQDVRIALLDKEEDPDIGTLLYRNSADPKEDVAVVFLAGRPFAVAESTAPFLEGMGSRLVVMLNSEDAASTFKVDNNALEFVVGNLFEYGTASEFCKTFEAQTYHYSSKVVNGWTTVLFRSYPRPWQLFVEDIYDQLFKLKELDGKPTAEEIAKWLEEYEEEQGITPMQKREKTLRDYSRL